MKNKIFEYLDFFIADTYNLTRATKKNFLKFSGQVDTHNTQGENF